MKFLLTLIFLSSSLFANTKLQTQIKELDIGTENEEAMLLLSSGHVAFLEKPSLSEVLYYQQAIRKGSSFEIVLNEDKEIISLTKIKHTKPRLNFAKALRFTEEQYHPTVLPSLDIAVDTFNKGRKDSKRISQCFNRAHVWSYEWDHKYQIQTGKVWLYFTRKYIRRYRFEWWFHVAPTVLVKTPEGIKERVMDIKYLKGPSTVKQWTDVFIRDRSDCPVISRYSDYSHNPEASLCYVQRSNPFYYQPVDLEKYELRGEEKTDWIPGDIAEAYKEAFGQTSY